MAKKSTGNRERSNSLSLSKKFDFDGVVWANTASLFSDLEPFNRVIGQVFNIQNGLQVDEYWFENGILDADLVLRSVTNNLTFDSAYIRGESTRKNTLVLDAGWGMIANKDTTDTAAPLPLGTPAYTLDTTPTWSNLNDISTVVSGQEYTFLSSGWLQTIRVWIPNTGVNYSYRVVISDTTDANNHKTSYIDLDLGDLTAGSWNVVRVGNAVILKTNKLLIALESSDSSASTTVTGGWTYSGQSNTATPTTGNWNHNNARTTLRINDTDSLSADRTTDLMSMIINTELTFVSDDESNRSITYRVTSNPVDTGTVITYGVVKIDVGSLGEPTSLEVTTMTATIPTPSATDYVEITNHWVANEPVFATIDGFLGFDGVNQNFPDNAYGVDIEFQRASISQDWNALSYSPELA